MDNRYITLYKLSEGATAQVFRGLDKKTDSLIIIKKCNRNGVASFDREVEILPTLKHRNIVRTIAISDSQMILESMDCDLFDYLERKQPSLPKIVKIFSKICKAVKYCHSKQIAHLDIKPENVLVKGKKFKLCDFGGSAKWTKHNRAIKCSNITPAYSPPEGLVRNNPILGDKYDIWSLGILLHVLCTKSWPYYITSEFTIEDLIADGDLTIAEEFPVILYPLLEKLLRVDPEERPSIDYICRELNLIKIHMILRKCIL